VALYSCRHASSAALQISDGVERPRLFRSSLRSDWCGPSIFPVVVGDAGFVSRSRARASACLAEIFRRLCLGLVVVQQLDHLLAHPVHVGA
jgi:hypothetical protein